tara:strand:- start:469 stop:1314 length:846 start_codon:yes stop_codon:yes gene_type:complete
MKTFVNSILFIFAILLLIAFANFDKKENNNYDLSNTNNMLFAHRGIAKFPENSWQSFNEAHKIGFKSLECDIQFTKDNKLIIYHDKNAKRLLGINKDIKDLMWHEIKDKPIKHNNKISKQFVLSLDELLKKSTDFQYIYLDVKISNKKIADSLITAIINHKVINKILIADANILFLSYLKLKMPKVKTVLEGFNKGKEWTYYIIPNYFKPNYFASFYSEIDDNHIKFLNDKKLIDRKIVYGIDKNNYEKALNKGLIHLILDYESNSPVTFTEKLIENLSTD